MSPATLETQSRSLLAEAERLISQNILRSGLLRGWVALESAARDVFSREGKGDLTPQELIPKIVEQFDLSERSADFLNRSLEFRNKLAHGSRTDEPPYIVVWEVLKAVRQLLKEIEPTDEMANGNRNLRVVFHPRMLKSSLRAFAERATDVLRDVVTEDQQTLLAEWDVAEDRINHQIALISLSDYSGKVSITFTPEEFGDTDSVRQRLGFLWSDLLRVRTDKLIEIMNTD